MQERGLVFMLSLTRNHDPKKNVQLLAKWLPIGRTMDNLALEAEQILKETIRQNDRKKKNAPLTKRLGYFFPRLLLTTRKAPGSAHPSVIKEGTLYPEWKDKLDAEYDVLNHAINRHVNVLDYGAVGDGITDCTSAFAKAIGHGRRMVTIPAGTYVVTGIRLPSFTCFVGDGKGQSVIKLSNQAGVSATLLANANPIRGNHHILVQGVTLDWNAARLPSGQKTSAGNNRSSCLTYAHVTYGWVKDVEAVNAGLHAFDLSASFYTYLGDGTWSRGPSRYIWVDYVTGHGFGDDGVTTHHSSQILITNSHMCFPSGRAHLEGFSNSNGFEVDDGSNDVWLIHNSSSHCFGGVEIKAHATASAASNVHIYGHLSVHDNRSFNFRHIGHHLQTDPDSLSAFNISAVNLVAIAPVYTDLYKGSSPRCLVVSAYQNVVINQLTMIGDPDYDYEGEPAAALQYKSKYITLRHVSSRHFKSAGTDIKIFGGNQSADNIQLEGLHFTDSAPIAIDIGPKVKNISISSLLAAKENGIAAIRVAEQSALISNIEATGYQTSIKFAGKPNHLS